MCPVGYLNKHLSLGFFFQASEEVAGSNPVAPTIVLYFSIVVSSTVLFLFLAKLLEIRA